MPGLFRVPGPLGLRVSLGLFGAPKRHAPGPLVKPDQMDTFFILSGGERSSPGIYNMAIKKPMIVGLEYGYTSDGTPIEVRCNGSNNPQWPATATSLGTDSTGLRRFEITGQSIGCVMLEGRLPMDHGNWWDWPLLATVQVSVSFDTEAEAKARCDAYAATAFPNTKENLPPGMDEGIWTRLLNFTRKHEGGTDFMYNDKGNPQRVTCGVGRMFPSPKEAVDAKSYFVTPDGRESSEDEVKADYAAAHNLVRTQGNLYEFATITQQRMPWDKVTVLLRTVMADKVKAVRAEAFAKQFLTFPAPAQVACASIMYGGWAYGCFAPTREAVAAQDWAKAADVYKSPGWDPAKDQAHIALFREAAQLKPKTP